MGAMSKSNKILYSILIGTALCFALIDLICGFSGCPDVASLFSMLSALIIGIGAYKTRMLSINSGVDKSIGYIKKNFDKWNVILSILDVICSLVALLSGFAVVGVITGIGLAGRIIVLIYKFRSVSFIVIGFVIIYLFKRRNKSMSKFLLNIKNNPRTLIFGVLSAGVFGFAGYYVANLVFASLVPWLAYPIAAIFGLAGFLLCCWIGWDNVKSIVFFQARKTLSPENYDKLVDTVAELENEQAEEQKAKAEAIKVADYESAKKIVAEYEKVQIQDQPQEIVVEPVEIVAEN